MQYMRLLKTICLGTALCIALPAMAFAFEDTQDLTCPGPDCSGTQYLQPARAQEERQREERREERAREITRERESREDRYWGDRPQRMDPPRSPGNRHSF